jgi:predicted nucleotidyltransferase
MNDKKHLDPLQKDRLTEQLSSFLTREDAPIAAAYLFGSFVTGASFSDLDVGLFMTEAPEQPLPLEIDLESRIEKATGIPTDVRVLNGAPLSFCYNVIRHGKLVLDREPNLRAAFQGRVLKEYFDFSRFRRRYLQEVVNAPV